MTVRVTPLHGRGAGQYYVREVGAYYLDAAEPPGVWFGQAAEHLGLSGPVGADAFVRLLDGVDPSTELLLGRRYRDRSVRGFDLTFSAPKSVSVLAGVADDTSGPRCSPRTTLQSPRSSAMWNVTRIPGGVSMVRFGCSTRRGSRSGAFRQHVSRQLDPQLHTHAVVAGKVLAPDGRWLALDARSLLVDQHTLTALYHAGLRSELTRRLGVAWQEPVRGLAELAGVDRAVIDEFSKRSAQVESRRDVKLARFRDTFDREPTPRERWRLDREAVTDSRPTKPKAEQAATLQDRWRAQLDEIGVPAPALVAAVVGRVLEPALEVDGERAEIRSERAVDALTDIAVHVAAP